MSLNPDWSKLEACRESLREHMQMCDRLKDQRNRIKTQTEQPLLVELKRLRALNANLLERAYREGWEDGYEANRLGLSYSEQETAKDWAASDTRQSLEEYK